MYLLRSLGTIQFSSIPSSNTLVIWRYLGGEGVPVYSTFCKTFTGISHCTEPTVVVCTL